MVEFLNSTVQAQIATGRSADRSLLLFDFNPHDQPGQDPAKMYGFWNGSGDIFIAGIKYQGVGLLIEINAYSSESDGSAVSVQVKLNAMEGSGLDPDILATIFQDITLYSQKPVTLSIRYIDPDTRVVQQDAVEYAGYVDKIEQQFVEGGENFLLVYCESRARDLTREGYRRHTDADQRLIDPNDGSLRHAQLAEDQKTYWGRATPETG